MLPRPIELSVELSLPQADAKQRSIDEERLRQSDAKGMINHLLMVAKTLLPPDDEDMIAGEKTLRAMAAGDIKHGYYFFATIAARTLCMPGITSYDVIVVEHAAQMGLFTQDQPFHPGQKVVLANRAMPDPVPAFEPASAPSEQRVPSTVVTAAKRATPGREGERDVRGVINHLLTMSDRTKERYGISFVAHNILRGMAAGVITHNDPNVGSALVSEFIRNEKRAAKDSYDDSYDRIVYSQAFGMGVITHSDNTFDLATEVPSEFPPQKERGRDDCGDEEVFYPEIIRERWYGGSFIKERWEGNRFVRER